MEHKKKILIVEDEYITAIAMKAGLESVGFDIVGIASSGEDAISMAAEAQPDAVLMDVNIQGNIGGIGAAREIRNRLDIPSAFLTGFPDKKAESDARELRPIGFFIKPVECSVLKNIIDAYFD